MFEVLQAYLQARAAFADEDFEIIRAMFVEKTLLSGQHLQRAGEVAKHASFVARGCLRSYIIDAKGKEHIVQFAPENWWLADNTSLAAGTPSAYFIDAVEDSDVLLIDPPSHEQLVGRVPGYAVAFRMGLQRRAAAREERIVNTLSKSAEERYLDFLETYPSIVTRVPQWMLASYLGVSPETSAESARNSPGNPDVR
jgi:CRP/FNR family transcriptional regulator, anaerobic regulatory protein